MRSDKGDSQASSVFSELVESVIGHVQDRAANPLTGSIAAFFVLVNFRLFLIIFSLEPLNKKLELIDSLYDGTIPTLLRVLGPIALGVAYVFLYSTPARWAASHVERERGKLADARREMKGLELITRQEARTLKDGFYQAEIEFNRRIHAEKESSDALREQLRHALERAESAEQDAHISRAALDTGLLESQASELAELRMKLALAESKIAESSKKGDMADAPIFESSEQRGIRTILVTLARQQDGASEEEIASETGLSLVYVRHIIGVLQKGELAAKAPVDDFSEGWEPRYLITERGVATALELGWDGA